MNSKGKIISIHQPNYIPWLGYFFKIYQSDIFVFLDDVQFSNQGMQNYHYIKTPQGSFRLKIPVLMSFGMDINQILINNKMDWQLKHLKTFESNYKRSPYFDEVFADITTLFKAEFENLADFNRNIIEFFCRKLGITTQFVNSSALNIDSNREEKIIGLCLALNGDTYYSGSGAKAYQDENNFKNKGIELKYSMYKVFDYPQLWGDFQSNVTIVDYLMNCGYDWDRVIQHQIAH